MGQEFGNDMEARDPASSSFFLTTVMYVLVSVQNFALTHQATIQIITSILMWLSDFVALLIRWLTLSYTVAFFQLLARI